MQDSCDDKVFSPLVHHQPPSNGSLRGTTITLRKSTSQQMQDIGVACQTKDMWISCRSGDTGYFRVPTSSLLLSVSSPFLKSMLNDQDEMPLIVLPDFNVEDVKQTLEYAERGRYQCRDQAQYDNLHSLSTVLRLGEKHRMGPNFPVKYPTKRDLDEEDEKTICPSTLLEIQYPYDFGEEELPSISQIKVEPELDNVQQGKELSAKEIHQGKKQCDSTTGYFAHLAAKEEDKVSLDKKADELNCDASSSQVIKKKKKLDKDSKENKVVKKKGRPPKAKTTKVSKRVPLCPVCKFDGGTLESSVGHVAQLLNNEFLVKPMVAQPRGTICCTICKHQFVSEARLRLHLKTHMQDAHSGTTLCVKCNAEFETTVAYFNHLKYHRHNRKSMEAGGDLRECPVCHKKVGSISFGNHVTSCRRKASEDYLMCDKCDFKTTVKANLNGHYARKHGAERPYTCTQCGKPFLRQGDLNQHMRRRHPAPGQEVICDICGKTSRDPYMLSSHKRTVHNSKHVYCCKLCNQSFDNRNKINRHILVHSDLELYKCNLCDKTFKNGPAGQHHRKTEHGGAGACTLEKSPVYEEMKKTLVLEYDKSQVQIQRPFKRFRGSVTANVAKVEELDLDIPG